jgi:Antibiotic biosynthesis monooxygenase
MSENVYWVLEFAVDPGRFEELKTLMTELVEATRKNEAGMLDNHWAISDDRQVCHIYERFQDSVAVMTHMQWFGPNFGERFMKILKPTRLVIYGTPSVEVKNAMAEFNPIYMAPLGGFRR